MKQLGGNASSVDGKDVGQSQSSCMKAESILFVLSGEGSILRCFCTFFKHLESTYEIPPPNSD